MKIAYIAGPYRSYKKDGGFNVDGIFENILEARRVAKKYWHLGYACVTPHLNTMLMDDDHPDTHWLEGDLEILKRCDVIVMMKDYGYSKGAVAELDLAREIGLEVIFDF